MYITKKPSRIRDILTLSAELMIMGGCVWLIDKSQGELMLISRILFTGGAILYGGFVLRTLRDMVRFHKRRAEYDSLAFHRIMLDEFLEAVDRYWQTQKFDSSKDYERIKLCGNDHILEVHRGEEYIMRETVRTDDIDPFTAQNVKRVDVYEYKAARNRTAYVRYGYSACDEMISDDPDRKMPLIKTPGPRLLQSADLAPQELRMFFLASPGEVMEVITLLQRNVRNDV